MAAEGQQHPIGIYLWVWGALFVVSGASYYVDWAGFQGALRWTLILIFMFIKAGAIVWVFMHMKWERLALFWAIMLPTSFICVFIFIMALEGDYTEVVRLNFFSDWQNFFSVEKHH
jgi:cytochrome c oxidase subunit IV